MTILNGVSLENQSGTHIFLLLEPGEQNTYSTITKIKKIHELSFFVLLHLMVTLSVDFRCPDSKDSRIMSYIFKISTCKLTRRQNAVLRFINAIP